VKLSDRLVIYEGVLHSEVVNRAVIYLGHSEAREGMKLHIERVGHSEVVIGSNILCCIYFTRIYETGIGLTGSLITITLASHAVDHLRSKGRQNDPVALTKSQRSPFIHPLAQHIGRYTHNNRDVRLL